MAWVGLDVVAKASSMGTCNVSSVQGIELSFIIDASALSRSLPMTKSFWFIATTLNPEP